MTSIGYFLLFGFTWLLSITPFWILYRISDVLFILIFYLFRYRKKIVYKNLRLAFPEKSEIEIDRIAMAFYRHFSDLLLESVKILTISMKNHEKRFRFLNLELIQQLEKEKKDFALVSAHYNNWEWMAFFPAMIGHKFLVIYRPLQNKTVDRMSRKLRGRCNPVLIPMERIFKEALKYRSLDLRFSIWFIADQRPPKSSHFWTTFLNQEVAFFEGVEKISRRMDLAVVFLDIRKVRRGYYEARLTKLIDNAAATGENEVMLSIIREMEKEIKAKPEFWLWSHNRFKHTRPEQIKPIKS